MSNEVPLKRFANLPGYLVCEILIHHSKRPDFISGNTPCHENKVDTGSDEDKKYLLLLPIGM